MGSNDTRHAIELSVEAEKLGADGLLSVTPYYNKASQEGLYRHYKLIAESVSLPVIVYNVPSRTGCNVDPKTLARLADIPNINGVKECNIDQVAEVLHLSQGRLNLYSGEDAKVLPLLSLGGQGVISVIANVVPDRVQRMVSAWFAGELAEAAREQIALVPLIRAMFSEVNPIPVKTALNLMGWAVGSCRMPLCDPSPQVYKLIQDTLADYGLLATHTP